MSEACDCAANRRRRLRFRADLLKRVQLEVAGLVEAAFEADSDGYLDDDYLQEVLADEHSSASEQMILHGIMMMVEEHGLLIMVAEPMRPGAAQ